MSVRSWLRRRVVLHKLVEIGECSIHEGESGERFYNLTNKGNQMAKEMLEEMREKESHDELLERYEVSWGDGSDSLEIQHRQSGWYVDSWQMVANFSENFFMHYYDGFPTFEKAIETIKRYLSVMGRDDVRVTKKEV